MKQLVVLVLALVACSCAQDDEPAAVAGPAVPAATAATAAPAPASGPDTPGIADIPPAIAVTVSEVAYGEAPGRNLNGYFVLPADIVEPVPGVILIHEQWGLNDYIRAMARRLAGEGYAVLAIDFYGGQTAESAGQAEVLRAEFMSDGAAVLDNIRQARTFLAESALPPGVAVLGFGLGGEWSLEAGIAFGDDIDAVVMFYGRVVNDGERLESLSAPLLGIFAAQDGTIPVREITQFRTSLRDADKTDALVLIESGVAHGFANPDSPDYNHAAAVENWDTAVDFLSRNLR